MKDIEINSDKYTVLLVVFFLAFALFMFVSDLHDLARHRMVLPDLSLSDYPAAIFSGYVAATAYRERKLRKDYPYGVAGMCLTALVLLVRIAAHWARGSPRAQDLCATSMTIVGVAASGLILTEGVRWFKKRVTLT